MDRALMIFFSQPVQIGLFLAALIAGWTARTAFNKGAFGRARTLGMIAFCSSSLIATSNVAFALFGSTTGFIMAALWGFFAYRDYQFLKMLPQRK